MTFVELSEIVWKNDTQTTRPTLVNLALVQDIHPANSSGSVLVFEHGSSRTSGQVMNVAESYETVASLLHVSTRVRVPA